MLKKSLAFVPLLCLILSTLCLSSCSLKKKVKKNKDSSFIANISTKFNSLYNSKTLLKEAIDNTKETKADYYQQTLSVFLEPNPNSVQQNKALLDSVIGKANHIINNKQESKYVGDAFLLKGKAYYYQGDYFNANEFFDYVANSSEYSSALMQEGLLWKIRSLLQLDNLNEASKSLDRLHTYVIENNRLQALSMAIQAKNSLIQNNHASAIAQLSQAIVSSPDKNDRLRWQYLIGQLLLEQGETDLAFSYFDKVAKSNGSYEMIFHANLYRIEILNQSNPTVQHRVSLLNKLLRDGKNKLYKGQIHQRIGDIYAQDDQIELAINQYQLASVNTVNDPYQKSVNYRKLAELYFEETKYAESSAYYDSTIMVLDIENPAYELLSRKQAHLSDLVKQLQVIAFQDTLIQLASLSTEDRELFIEKVLLDNTPAEVQLTQKKNKANQSTLDNNEFNFASTATPNSSFYFSSQVAISQGFSNFKNRWGNRESGNYWRYSDQVQSHALEQNETSAALNPENPAIENNVLTLRDRYLQGLPDTPEKLEQAHNTIKEAFLALGNLYQYELLDQESAIQSYEDYLHRFVKDDNTAMLYYQLYRLNEEHSPVKSGEYKQRLLQEYPQSKFSLTLIDPLYYQKQYDLLKQFNERYTQVYSLFSEQNYVDLLDLTDSIYNDPHFQPLGDNLAQLAYIRAVAIGRTAPVEDFKDALNKVIQNHSEEEVVVPLIKQHLAYIDSNEAQFNHRPIALDQISRNRTAFEKEFALTPWPDLSFSNAYSMPQVRKEYEVSDGQTGLKIVQHTQNKNTISIKNIDIGKINPIRHENSYRDITLLPDTATYYFVINVMHGTINLSPSRYGLGQFNRGNYPASALQHHLKTISDDSQLIYVGNFSTFAEAKAYEQKINSLLSSIMKVEADLYYSFIVTEAVFSTFGNENHVDDYYSLYQTQQQTH